MPLRIIRASALVRIPWKNGGGTTAEIAVHPQGAGFDDFGWRLSVADVTSDGAFSIFPGIDRTLVVLAGVGITLYDDGWSHRLDASSPSLSFSGDRSVTGRLLDGPIRDFNVMTRRGVFSHSVRMIGSETFEGPDSWTVCLARRGRCAVKTGGRAYRLEALDAALIHQWSTPIEVEGPSVLVTIKPVEATG